MLDWLICVLCVSPWVHPVWRPLGFLDLDGYFLLHFREVFYYYLLKYFLMPFLFCLLILGQKIWMLGHLTLSQRSLRLSSFLLPFSSLLHLFPLFIFHLTYPFFYLSYSTVCSFQSVFNFSYCIIHYWLTFFISYNSLLNISFYLFNSCL